MCGRYALSLRPSVVRQRLADDDMPAEHWPDDDGSVRQTYNFAPGSQGLVYRADVPDAAGAAPSDNGDASSNDADHDTLRYKLAAHKWGLIPHWQKRPGDYGSMLKTINARDDSLARTGGMWNTMKQKKRCLVICEGFYEWQKKNGGREKIPHYMKRKDGRLMMFAGLWDGVRYEGQDETLYTYTIITTSSNKQLSWLHDRMPVILDPHTDAIKTWLDPARTEWSKELQDILQPYKGELELYPVDQAVGKVGNNSPSFVVPVDSKENKKNIANFFAGKKEVKKESTDAMQTAGRDGVKDDKAATEDKQVKSEARDEVKVEVEGSESNAPLPQSHDANGRQLKGIKREASDKPDTSPSKSSKQSHPDMATTRKTRSATSNTGTKPLESPEKAADGSEKITNFFGK